MPSGFLQTWPDGSPLTIHSLASLMISQSDNTATDVLLDLVGRANVEKVAPSSTPFLSTREAFALKEHANASLLARFRAGDEAARRSVLTEIAKMKLGNDHSTEPYALDVEWHIGARKLCDLLSRNKAIPALHINPGVATASQWDLVAYKGGSEPGVLNYSTWVEKAGHSHCVVTTWNDPASPVDGAQLTEKHRALLAALRGPK
jgi:beta-lactamase class A